MFTKQNWWRARILEETLTGLALFKIINIHIYINNIDKKR